MGTVDMPAYADYWSQRLRFDKVASVMSLKRYEQIRRNIHYCDHSAANHEDRWFKVRPLFESVRQNCIKIENEKQQSVDEMMVPYKGKKAGSRRQYIKSKPKKWGLSFCACRNFGDGL